MSHAHKPRRGSLQFWPRKRSRHSLVRVRSWAAEQNVKPLAFIGYKAGMTHLMITDNRPRSGTKGESIMVPSTIIECPPLQVMGVVFYKNFRKTATVLAEKPSKHLSKKLPLPKKELTKIDMVSDVDDLRLLVHSLPERTTIGAKKPQVLEIALGGSIENKLAYAKEKLGGEIAVTDVLAAGNQLDVRGITKGKGFQGTVKRYGVPIRQHKAEKTKRGIATLGSWTPKRVQYSVAQPGKMGYHQRTEYNKHLLAIGDDGEAVTPRGGLTSYGRVKNTYLLIKGSITGPRKRAVVFSPASRPNSVLPKEAPEITVIAK